MENEGDSESLSNNAEVDSSRPIEGQKARNIGAGFTTFPRDFVGYGGCIQGVILAIAFECYMHWKHRGSEALFVFAWILCILMGLVLGVIELFILYAILNFIERRSQT